VLLKLSGVQITAIGTSLVPKRNMGNADQGMQGFVPGGELTEEL
jgi:hypothetical protein